MLSLVKSQAGDHVHLGPGVTGTRLTDPAFPIEDLPSVDVVVLSHFHAGECRNQDSPFSLHLVDLFLWLITQC